MAEQDYTLSYGPRQLAKEEAHRRRDTLDSLSEQQHVEVATMGETTVVGDFNVSSAAKLHAIRTLEPETFSIA
jgi:hypothetical protein